MSKVLKGSRIALFFLAMAVASTAVAAQKATPSGKVTLESTSIAAGIGVSWGDGKLTFKGKTFPFSIDGLSLVDWGISKAQATGDVYNLTDPAKLGGTYVAAEAGLTWPAAWAAWCCAIRMAWSCTCVLFLRAPGCN